MISWDYWQTLLAVLRGGNYARAARALNIDATTVGRRLKALERHMGHALLLREDGRLCPTSQCEKLLTHLEEAFEALRQAENSTAASDRGILWRIVRITAPPFMINNIYSSSADRLDESRKMQLELIGTGSNLNLTRREADIAIRIYDNPASASHDAHNVAAEKIGDLEFVVCHRKGKSTDSIPWAGLTDSHIANTGTKTMYKLVGKHGLQYRVSHFDALENLLASGVAKGLLPKFMADKNERLSHDGGLVLTQPLWMLFHRQDEKTLHQLAAREWIMQQTRNALANG